MSIHILHVEDDEVVQMALKRMAKAKGLPYEIDAAGTFSAALELLGENSYDIALLDYKLPDGTGIDLLQKTREKEMPAIIITGTGEPAVAVKALKGGAYDYLIKDLGNEYLEFVPAIIEKVMRAAYLELEHKKNVEQLRFMNAELSRLYEETRELALYDPLTGLANRRLMEITLKQAIARARRTNEPLSALMLDIDFFKKYNDTHGHPAGDRLLTALAKTLLDEIRESDLIVRYGGEEFFVILPAISLDAACIIAERIRKAVEASLGVTISIGASAFDSKSQNMQELIDKADKALYQAKQKGRNKVERIIGGAEL